MVAGTPAVNVLSPPLPAPNVANTNGFPFPLMTTTGTTSTSLQQQQQSNAKPSSVGSSDGAIDLSPSSSRSPASGITSPPIKGGLPPNLKRKKSNNCEIITVNTPTSSDPRDIQLYNLVKENESLRLKIRDLKLKHKRQRLKNGFHNDDDDDDDFNSNNGKRHKNSTGSNTEGDEEKLSASPRYYGPNSANFMITNSLTKTEMSEFDSFIKVRKQLNQKRKLPMLISKDCKVKKSKLNDENLNLIITLINKFFHLRYMYCNYLHREPLIEFLNNYPNINTWSNNEDCTLLLIIILLIVCLRSMPHNDEIMIKYKLNYTTLRPSLYKQYRNLRNGIQLETTTSLRAYTLECEDLFFNDEVEQSWNLLFRIVSSAYSLGLHVYDDSIVKTLKAESSIYSADIVRANPKSSLWLIINFISATLCSVLGRPNPVTFNYEPLLKNYPIRLNYKIALAGLVKKSTDILIESYKVTIKLDTILDIDDAFLNEAIIYEKILIDTRNTRDFKDRGDIIINFRP
ncbi:unnamed protein product [Ambrosiozyma monospora]|uniref:Unnamed protein product n=1 Tax=Ambrosiozyma monospora TaxID=43982 RepID=A0ACB5SYT1_AMBMO|nr:unnamed protein product [Ambrosiozyma monospora]